MKRTRNAVDEAESIPPDVDDYDIMPFFHLSGQLHNDVCLVDLEKYVAEVEAQLLDLISCKPSAAGRVWMDHILPFPTLDCTGYKLVLEEATCFNLPLVRVENLAKDAAKSISKGEWILLRNDNHPICSHGFLMENYNLDCEECHHEFQKGLSEDWYGMQLLKDKRWSEYERGLFSSIIAPRMESACDGSSLQNLRYTSATMIKLLEYNLILRTDNLLKGRCNRYLEDSPAPMNEIHSLQAIVCGYLGGSHDVPRWFGTSYVDMWNARVVRRCPSTLPVDDTESVLMPVDNAILLPTMHGCMYEVVEGVTYSKIGLDFWTQPTWTNSSSLGNTFSCTEQ
jgi:hypothetical protein